jgi:hypothetical protein
MNLCIFSLLSCSSVDNKTEDTRHGLFKFKARPLDRKVADINNIVFLFVSSFYEGSCPAVFTEQMVHLVPSVNRC